MIPTAKPKKIELTQEQKIKKAKEIIKNKPAKAVKVNEEEYQEVITGKLVEAINLQKKYRQTFLVRLYKTAQLTELANQIEAEKINILWEGMKCPMKIVKCKFNILHEEYKECIAKENYLKQALVNMKFQPSELIQVAMQGVYVKDAELKKKLD